MHLRLIAEGVDSAEQVTFLKAHGCLAAQGFYYNKPVPAEEFTELLKETNYSDYRLEIAN
jgi:EAL domain-containing protein (putative c-di-GMP-specific phosphodiesterase class I)